MRVELAVNAIFPLAACSAFMNGAARISGAFTVALEFDPFKIHASPVKCTKLDNRLPVVVVIVGVCFGRFPSKETATEHRSFLLRGNSLCLVARTAYHMGAFAFAP